MSAVLLESLLMRNFKCFTDLQIQFGKLTVLSGFNGTGKSTAIQPVLLLSQLMNDLSVEEKERGKYWPLNGEMVRLGKAGDVVNQKLSEELGKNLEIEFSFGFSNGYEATCNFNVESDSRYLTNVRFDAKNFKVFDFMSQLSFISAVRGGLDELYPIPDESDYSRLGVGTDGRFASFVYHVLDNTPEKFSELVDSWLDSISPGSKARVLSLEDFSKMALEFKLSKSSAFRKPSNVGFGLSYAFPIIVELLASREGSFIIIDSPEAHLHPKAQSNMGKMIAEFASLGIQLVVETHSDHVLNGIRIAVLEKILNPEDLSILFFSGAEDDKHGVISPNIDADGYLSDWPEGFFDQIDIDNSKLIGFS